MPNKYKIEITQTEKYIVDVEAENLEQAHSLATTKWNEIAEHGMQHYHQVGDTETEITDAYDVTHTDDPFNP